MVPEIKKILYATDLSQSAKHAFGYAADLAQKYNAMLTIVYVIENINHTAQAQIMDHMGADEWERFQKEKSEDLIRKIKLRIEDFCKDMASHFDSCHLLVEEIRIEKGNPTEQILDISKEIDADMIVMGTYGHNILQDAFAGGTARKVVRTSKVPVLVVRLPEDD